MNINIVQIDDNLKDLINSIQNRCEIFWLIADLPSSPYLVSTLLEDLYNDSQVIIDNYCILKEVKHSS